MPRKFLPVVLICFLAGTAGFGFGAYFMAVLTPDSHCKDVKLDSSPLVRSVQDAGAKPTDSTPLSVAPAKPSTATPTAPADNPKKDIADPKSHPPEAPVDQNPPKAGAEPAAPGSAAPTTKGAAEMPSAVEQQAKAAGIKKQKPKPAERPAEDLLKSWQQIQGTTQ